MAWDDIIKVFSLSMSESAEDKAGLPHMPNQVFSASEQVICTDLGQIQDSYNEVKKKLPDKWQN